MAGHRRFLRFDLTQQLLEEPPADLLSAVRARKKPLFADLVRAVRRVATDPDLAGIVARVGGPAPVLALAPAQELRAALLAVRAAGKPTLGFAETFGESGPGTVGYLAAVAFSQLWLQPSGDVGLTGFAAQTVFAREALDRLGVHARIGQRQEYKNAPDTLLSTGYSDAHREALTAVVEALFGQVVDAVAADRGIPADTVRELTTRAPLTPDGALDARLIDRIGYRDEFAEEVEKVFGDARPTDVAHVLARTAGLRHPAGALPRSGSRPALAVVSVIGGIRAGRSGRSGLQGMSSGSDTVCAALRLAARDPGIAGVVLRVDSPGGSYLASDTIRREVLRLRRIGKPVVASMGTYAASGGYFVSMGADRILAQPATLTGSIGVFGGKVVTRELAERYGIRRDAVTAGGHARLASAAVDYDEQEWAFINAALDRVYDDFTAKAAADRHLPLATLRDLARGRVWVGSDALERGLVDGLGGLESARRAAAELTGLDPDTAALVRIPATDLVSRVRAAAGGDGPAQPVGAGGTGSAAGAVDGLDGVLAGVLDGLLAGSAGFVGASGGSATGLGQLASALRPVVDALSLLSAGPGGVLRLPEHLLV